MQIAAILLAASIVVTALLIVSGYVNYAPTVSRTDLQNAYIDRTTKMGLAAIILQAGALVAVLRGGRKS
jgi:hypothetical protein